MTTYRNKVHKNISANIQKFWHQKIQIQIKALEKHSIFCVYLFPHDASDCPTHKHNL